MHRFRALLGVAATLLATPASSDQVFGPATVDSSGSLFFQNGPQIGTYSGGKYVAKASNFISTESGLTPYTFAGLTQYSSITSIFNAARSDAAEAGIYISVQGTAGGGIDQSFYKVGLVSEAVAQPGSGPVFGANVVASLAPQGSFTNTAQINGIEIDLNNSDAPRGGSVYQSPNRAVGLLLNGSGNYMNNTAIEIAGGSGNFSLWEVGLRFSQPPGASASGINVASIQNETASTYLIRDISSHAYGLTLSGSYSQFSILAPGFRVDGGGGVYAGALIVTPGTVPYSTLPCTQGQIVFDINYVNFCVNTNSWKRVQLQNF
ncbi:hypothetical protein [uncultured Methylobacterium sp.]|uniref:hypothetical protein n=1 Tax=uncultured Methylobacterium sp. TaxID=157278 RepID=UPI0035CB2375